MPYAVAHPLAVIPLARALGRRGVASALAIGSVIPDAWYLVPGIDRAFSHNASGLLLFCLPAGLLAYLAFHAVAKEPLLQLLPQRLASRVRAFASPGLPPASWTSVCASLLLGAATHLAWDAFTHRGRLSRAWPFLTEDVLHVLQHGSTLVGGALLAWWLVRKLRAVAPVHAEVLPEPMRTLIAAALVCVAAVSFALGWAAASGADVRWTARAAAVVAASVTGFAVLLYSVLFRSMRAVEKRQRRE